MAVAMMNHVRFAYPRKKPLFEQLDVSIQPGGVYGLLGKNGAGKTSLLKLMVGLLFAQDGEATVLGHPAEQRHPDALGRIYMVPESFVLPRLTVDQYVNLNNRMYPGFDLKAAEATLTEFEVPRGERLDTLSFGQQKKVELTVALSSGATLTVLDEPTNALDIPSKQVFRRLVARMAGEDRSIIISTHQVRDVENLIDPITIVHEGKVVFDATLDRIMSSLALVRFMDSERPSGLTPVSERTDLGETVALIPQDQAASAGGLRVIESLDIELLFQGAIENPEQLRKAVGAGAAMGGGQNTQPGRQDQGGVTDGPIAGRTTVGQADGADTRMNNKEDN